LSTGVAPG